MEQRVYKAKCWDIRDTTMDFLKLRLRIWCSTTNDAFSKNNKRHIKEKLNLPFYLDKNYLLKWKISLNWAVSVNPTGYTSSALSLLIWGLTPMKMTREDIKCFTEKLPNFKHKKMYEWKWPRGCSKYIVKYSSPANDLKRHTK